MSPATIVALALLLLVGCSSSDLPSSNSKIFNVISYGAVGNGVSDDTAAVRTALKAAASYTANGNATATVVLPSRHIFLSNPINISSYITLQVDGTLKAVSGNNSIGGIAAWPQIPPLPSYGNSRDGPYTQYQAFIYANGAEDIAIVGNGTIDGQGDWWWHNQRNRTLLTSGRPNLVQFVNCTRVEVTGVTLRDSPFWCLHPVYCDTVHVHHMSIRSRMYAPNSDGIDPDSSRNVMIEHNDISCGDDHIAIKAGVCGASSPNDCRDPHFTLGDYRTENVTVRFNTFRIGMGISVGSESSGGIRDVNIHGNIVGLCDAGHCLDTCCGWGPALHLKTTLTRGGVIENIMFRNNTIINNTGFIDMQTNYQSGDVAPVGYPATVVRNISFIGNRAIGGATGATWTCSVKDACEDLTVINNTIAGVRGGQNPFSCAFIQSFDVHGNVPGGFLEECMERSMNRSDTGALGA